VASAAYLVDVGTGRASNAAGVSGTGPAMQRVAVTVLVGGCECAGNRMCACAPLKMWRGPSSASMWVRIVQVATYRSPLYIARLSRHGFVGVKFI